MLPSLLSLLLSLSELVSSLLLLTPILDCSAVMLVGTKKGNISVGEVEKDHTDEVTHMYLTSSNTDQTTVCGLTFAA